MRAAAFLRRVLAKRPYQAHTVLPDNGIQFGNLRHQPWAFRHIFDRVCPEHGIGHRFPQPGHPWTDGPVERLNRTLKEATVQRYHDQTTAHLNEHRQTFLLAYHHAKRLKTLRGLTPHEFICAQWQQNPAIFTQDPTHLTLGLYSV
jgi:transposase InsO family protein